MSSVGPHENVHDSLTYEDTEGVLHTKCTGTFLIRKSLSSPDSVVVAYVASDKSVIQVLLSQDTDGTWSDDDGNLYDSLDEVVTLNANILRFQIVPVENACPVCLDKLKRNALVPCGHMFCDGCAAVVHSCPLCRHDVAQTVRVFL